jgi:diacylglycerol kinase (ATP)
MSPTKTGVEIMPNHETHFILNPASGAGKTRSKVSTILRLINHSFGSSYSLHMTSGPLDATSSTSEAVRNGARLVVAIGGDGTIQEVVNGMFSNGDLIDRECRLGIINCGTGHGFAQSLALPSSIEAQMELLTTGDCRAIDLGRVSYWDSRGEICRRYFVNECQLGIGAAVVRRVQGRHKKLGGTLAFGLGVLETVFEHENQRIAMMLDQRETFEGKVTGIVLANGAFTGGGMNLAPTARLDDGTLKVLVMHDLSIWQRLQSFPRIYAGSHLGMSLFSYREATSLTVKSSETVRVEADGELLGETPCLIEAIPSVLKVQSVSKNGGSSCKRS